MKRIKSIVVSVVVSCACSPLVQADQAFSPDTVVAKRGDAVVTMLDIDAKLQRVPPRMRANVMNNPKRIEELIDGLLVNRQLALEAHAEKLDQGEVFERAVQLQTEGLLAEMRLADYREKLDIGDLEELARERYQVNPDAYAVRGVASARHILVDTKTRSDDEAKALADEIHAKAIAGADFESLVMQYSDDPSKSANKGLIPNADSDSMAPEFAAAVKALTKVGEISPVVKTSFGYHVIELASRTPSRSRSFDEAKAEIMAEIDQSMRATRLQTHIDELKNMPIEADPEVVASLRTRFLPDKGEGDSKAADK